MGKHFDGLVELVNRHMRDREGNRTFPDPRRYLREMLDRAVLFEFDLDPAEIFPRSGMDGEEYDQYIFDYFRLSAQHGQHMIRPFPITAIEDTGSVVILEPLQDERYRVIHSRLTDGKVTVFIGDVELQWEELQGAEENIYVLSKQEGAGRTFRREVYPLYLGDFDQGQRGQFSLGTSKDIDLCKRAIRTMPEWFNSREQTIETGRSATIALREVQSREEAHNCQIILRATYFRLAQVELLEAAQAYMQENVCIMDPRHFILKKEVSRRPYLRERRQSKKKLPKIKKTIERPRYSCMTKDDTEAFLSGRVREPAHLHLVVGHWRHLHSEYYRHQRGQIIPVRQHVRGIGDTISMDGMKYTVIVKESPTTLVEIGK